MLKCVHKEAPSESGLMYFYNKQGPLKTTKDLHCIFSLKQGLVRQLNIFTSDYRFKTQSSMLLVVSVYALSVTGLVPIHVHLMKVKSIER